MKLSDLQVGQLYTIDADDVEAIIQVITPGGMPLVMLHGNVRDYASNDENPIIKVQLIGWAPWGEGLKTPQGLRLFATDDQPEYAWLIGMRLRPDGSPEFLKLACSPTITECGTAA